MSTTTVVVGVACFIGGAIVGGAAVHKYHKNKERKIQEEKEKYREKFKSLDLQNKTVEVNIS